MTHAAAKTKGPYLVERRLVTRLEQLGYEVALQPSVTHFRYLQQHDRRNHRNDEHYHCHGQPDTPVFLVSRMLSCLKFLISCGSLCVPSDLLLLSGFPVL